MIPRDKHCQSKSREIYLRTGLIHLRSSGLLDPETWCGTLIVPVATSGSQTITLVLGEVIGPLGPLEWEEVFGTSTETVKTGFFKGYRIKSISRFPKREFLYKGGKSVSL